MTRQAKKTRIPLSQDIDAEVLFKSHHTCCKCREYGKPVQIHHIDENPSNNVLDNLAVLCLICHNETMASGGFGKKLKNAEVVKYRDDWLERVKTRRDEADKIAIQLMAASPAQDIEVDPSSGEVLMFNGQEDLVRYVERLPIILAAAYSAAGPLWSGTTYDMVMAADEVTEVVIKMLVTLAQWYPENHFDEKSAEIYFSKYVSERATWCRALAEPKGYGTGGSIVRVNTACSLRREMENAVEAMVESFFSDMTGEYIPAFEHWQKRWIAAKN